MKTEVLRSKRLFSVFWGILAATSVFFVKKFEINLSFNTSYVLCLVSEFTPARCEDFSQIVSKRFNDKQFA